MHKRVTFMLPLLIFLYLAQNWPPREGLPNAQRTDLNRLGTSSLYFYGDSTMRQLWGAFLASEDPPTASFAQLKKFVRSECPMQLRVFPYKPPETDPTGCGANERTCNITRGRLHVIYDWKHFIYEDYDEHLLKSFSRSAPVLIVGPGLHDCYHNFSRLDSPFGHLEVRVLALLNLIRNSYRGPVLWVTTVSPRGVFTQMDSCCRAVNDAAKRHAHVFNVDVLDRYETFAKLDQDLTGDGLHFHDDVYTRLNRDVLSWVRRNSHH